MNETFRIFGIKIENPSQTLEHTVQHSTTNQTMQAHWCKYIQNNFYEFINELHLTYASFLHLMHFTVFSTAVASSSYFLGLFFSLPLCRSFFNNNNTNYYECTAATCITWPIHTSFGLVLFVWRRFSKIHEILFIQFSNFLCFQSPYERIDTDFHRSNETHE